MDRCIVCHARIDKEKAYLTLKYKGEEYLACCPLCKSKFEKKPGKYTGDKKQCSEQNNKNLYRCSCRLPVDRSRETPEPHRGGCDVSKG